MQQLLERVLTQLKSERLARAYERLGNAYALKPNDRPPVVELAAPGIQPKAGTWKELAESPEHNVDFQLQAISSSLSLETDYTPMFDLSVSFGTVPAAEAFGCKIDWVGANQPWAKPAITDASQVWSIKKPKLSECRMIQAMREHIDYANRVFDGRIPMHIIDMQCPFSTAAQVWDAEPLMMACYTDPDAVHAFMRIVTDFLIEFLHEYIHWLEIPMYPGRNFPSILEDIGICIADDTPLIMLSPEQYAEFALPYNIEVAEAFGGLSIHSCGDYTHQLDNILQIPNLKAIQCHIGPGEMPPQPVIDKINGKLALWCDWNPVTLATYKNSRELYEAVTLPEVKTMDAGLILMSTGGATPEEIHEGYDWVVSHWD